MFAYAVEIMYATLALVAIVFILGWRRAATQKSTDIISESSKKTQRKPLSEAAINLKAKLHLKDDHVITLSFSGEMTEHDWQVLQYLLEITCNIYLVCGAYSDNEEAEIKNKVHVATNAIFDEHKVLCHETQVGKIAIIRQLKSELHIDRKSCLLLNSN